MPTKSFWLNALEAGFGLSTSIAAAEPIAPPFYQAAMKLKPFQSGHCFSLGILGFLSRVQRSSLKFPKERCARTVAGHS